MTEQRETSQVSWRERPKESLLTHRTAAGGAALFAFVLVESSMVLFWFAYNSLSFPPNNNHRHYQNNPYQNAAWPRITSWFKSSDTDFLVLLHSEPQKANISHTNTQTDVHQHPHSSLWLSKHTTTVWQSLMTVGAQCWCHASPCYCGCIFNTLNLCRHANALWSMHHIHIILTELKKLKLLFSVKKSVWPLSNVSTVSYPCLCVFYLCMN